MSRLSCLALAGVASLGIAIPAAVDLPTRLVWNASASTPVGLYLVVPVGELEVADLVMVAPPEPLARFLAERGYMPTNVPLMKRVVGLPWQQICRAGSTVTVDGITIGEALPRDRHGRDLPVWQGCRVLAEDEVFLMNPSVPGSLDGRYFGPLPAGSITGRAVPLWTDQAGDGRFAWRASVR